MLSPAWAALLVGTVLSTGIVIEGEQTTLPVSPTGELPSMEPTRGDEMPFGDAGLAWVPEASSDLIPTEVPDAGRVGAPPAAPDAGPAAPLPPACLAIQERIDHRRTFLTNVGNTVVLVGYEKATETWCQHHPDEVECRRPPDVSERDISEVTVRGTEGENPPEADPWIVRWDRELAQCRASAKTKPARLTR